MIKKTLIGAILIFISILSGCAAPIHYTPSPNTNQMEPIIEFSSNGEIALVNNQPMTDEVVYCSKLDMYANYNKWTDVVIQILNREITKRGMKVTISAPKSMKIAVKYAKTDVGFSRVETHIVMAVETASGYKKEYIGRNKSFMGAVVTRQTDGALMRAVAKMLNDPEIVKYLKQ